MTDACPYCGESGITDVSGQAAPRRPEFKATLYCGECTSYSVRYRDGRIMPLAQPNNINGDPVRNAPA